MRLEGDFFLTHFDQIFGTADHTRQRAAYLHMRNRANGLQLEHKIKRRHFQRANIGHAQHIGHIFNGGAGQPALLLLGAPQKRNDRRGLAALGVFCHLRFGPSLVGGREGKAFRLFVVQATQHQARAPVL